jgi:hypothetical protein
MTYVVDDSDGYLRLRGLGPMLYNFLWPKVTPFHNKLERLSLASIPA